MHCYVCQLQGQLGLPQQWFWPIECVMRFNCLQSKRKADKAGYQREMAGMQSRLLGAMRRLVYVADKAAVKDATIAERDAYVNRLEQQLVTKPASAQQPPCKARTDAVKVGRQRPNRRCHSHGPAFRSPSPSPGARSSMHTRMTGLSSQAKERGSANSTPAVGRVGALRRPATAGAGHSGSSGYRQKHALQSKARLLSQSGPRPSNGIAQQSVEQAANRVLFGRLGANLLEAATPATPSVVAAGGSATPESGVPASAPTGSIYACMPVTYFHICLMC